MHCSKRSTESTVCAGFLLLGFFHATDATADVRWTVSEQDVGHRYLCPLTAEPPVIDGDLGEWNLEDAPIQVNRKLAPKIGIISRFVRDDADLRADGCFSWDEENLYFAFSVDDDVVIEVSKDHRRNLKPWETDSIMISLHTGEGLEGAASTFVAVAPTSPDAEQPFLLPSMNVRTAVVKREKGYNVEMSVPFKGWKAMSRTMGVKSGLPGGMQL